MTGQRAQWQIRVLFDTFIKSTYMEDKQLTGQESLDLIARMINNTRRNFNDRGGSMFLIWGYTTVAVTIGAYIALLATRSYAAMWLWWALPVIGGILTWLHFRRHKRGVQTHLDKAVNYVWIIFAVACMTCVLFSFGSGFFFDRPHLDILFTVALLIGAATALTGLMIQYRPVVAGGIAAIVLSLLILIFPAQQFLIFAGIFLVAQVIPGHMLNSHCKKERRQP